MSVPRRVCAALRRDGAADALEPQVDKECISCGHRGLSFHTMQARRRAAALSRRARSRAACSCVPRTRDKPYSSSAWHASTSGPCTHDRCAARRALSASAVYAPAASRHGPKQRPNAAAPRRTRRIGYRALRACDALCAFTPTLQVSVLRVCGTLRTLTARRRCPEAQARSSNLRVQPTSRGRYPCSRCAAHAEARVSRASNTSALHASQAERVQHLFRYGPRSPACRGNGPSALMSGGRIGPRVMASGSSAPSRPRPASAAPSAKFRGAAMRSQPERRQKSRLTSASSFVAHQEQGTRCISPTDRRVLHAPLTLSHWHARAEQVACRERLLEHFTGCEPPHSLFGPKSAAPDGASGRQPARRT